jgi:hypothetical protein
VFNLGIQGLKGGDLLHRLMGEEELSILRTTPEQEIEEFLEEHDNPHNCYCVYDLICDRALCVALRINYRAPTKIDCYVALKYLLRINSQQDCARD